MHTRLRRGNRKKRAHTAARARFVTQKGIQAGGTRGYLMQTRMAGETLFGKALVWESSVRTAKSAREVASTKKTPQTAARALYFMVKTIDKLNGVLVWENVRCYVMQRRLHEKFPGEKKRPKPAPQRILRMRF